MRHCLLDRAFALSDNLSSLELGQNTSVLLGDRGEISNISSGNILKLERSEREI